MKKNDIVTIIPTGEIGIVSFINPFIPDMVEIELNCVDSTKSTIGYSFYVYLENKNLMYIGKL